MRKNRINPHTNFLIAPKAHVGNHQKVGVRVNREDFEKVMKKGGFLNSSFFTLRFLKNPLNSTHFSVVVSKKVAKTAVLRNKIRRRAYSILRKHEKTFKNKGFLILFAKKGVEKATFKEIEADIEKAVEKAKIC